MEEYQPTEFELFEEKANEVYENFLEGLQGDPKYVRPVNEDDPEEADGALFMYTCRAMNLVEHLCRRISRLCERKFGFDKAFDLELESHLYREY